MWTFVEVNDGKALYLLEKLLLIKNKVAFMYFQVSCFFLDQSGQFFWQDTIRASKIKRSKRIAHVIQFIATKCQDFEKIKMFVAWNTDLMRRFCTWCHEDASIFLLTMQKSFQQCLIIRFEILIFNLWRSQGECFGRIRKKAFYNLFRRLLLYLSIHISFNF